MFVRTLVRLVRYLVRQRGAQLLRTLPPAAEVAILDATNYQDMVALCGGETFVVVDPNGPQLHLTAGLFLSALKWTFKTGLPEAGYAIALLEKIDPAITITLIDNARLSYEVSRHFTRGRFLAIQNAARFDTAHLPPDLARAVHLREFACFGQYEVDLYQQKGATVGRFYPLGALKDSFYRARRAPGVAPVINDICVVAEPSPGWDQLEYPGMEDAIGNIAKYAVRFGREHNKRVRIAGKRSVDAPQRPSEVAWYEKYVGREIEVSPRVRDEFTTYQLIDQSEISIAFISSALQEGVARGNRVLFCNYTGQERWNFPVPGIWQLTEPGYEAFEKRLLELLAMSPEEFRAASRDARQYVMEYDEKMPTHVFLQNLIAGAVSDRKVQKVQNNNVQ